MSNFSRFLTLILASLAAFAHVAAAGLSSFCENDDSSGYLVIQVVGDFYTYDTITLTGGSGMEYGDSPVSINSDTATITNKGSSSSLDTTIEGFNCTNEAIITVFSTNISSSPGVIQLILSGDEPSDYRQFPVYGSPSGPCSSSSSSSASTSTEAATTTDETTAVSTSATSTEMVSTESTSSEAVSAETSSSETTLSNSTEITTPTTVPTTAASSANSTSIASITSSVPTSAIPSSSVNPTSSSSSPTNSIQLPSVSGFDDDGAAGWVVTVPESYGPYADLKLMGQADNFSWDLYVEASKGSPDITGDHSKLEVDVSDFYGDEDYVITVFAEPRTVTTVETIVATLTLEVEYDSSYGKLKKRAAASTSTFTIEGTATVAPVVSSSSSSSAIASSTSVASSSSSGSSSSVSSSETLTVVTTVLPSTTVVTVTSCSDGKCTATPVTTGLTTITNVDTVYTTYCPLTGVATTKTYTPVVLTATISASPESTTTLTITSCSDNKCSSSVVTTGLAKTTDTVDGTTTVYTTYCPLSDETLTSTVYKTLTLATSSATTSAEASSVASSSSAAPAVPSLSIYAGLAASVTPLAGTILGSAAFVAALFI